jgi:hypothetical protein
MVGLHLPQHRHAVRIFLIVNYAMVHGAQEDQIRVFRPIFLAQFFSSARPLPAVGHNVGDVACVDRIIVVAGWELGELLIAARKRTDVS